MNNQSQIQKALNIQQTAAGNAAQRYGLYLESVEAKANKMKTALEGVWQKTINSQVIGQVYDLVTGILNLVEAVGGLAPVITLVTGLWLAFNLEMMITQAMATGGMIPTLITNIQKLGIALTSLSATNAIVLAITAIALAVQAVNTQLIETNRLGIEANQGRWTELFDSIKASGGGAKEELKAFQEELSRVNKIVQDAGLAGVFVDKNSLIANGLSEVIDRLKLSSTSYEEYRQSATAAFEAAGYSVDKHGKVYKELALSAEAANESTRLYIPQLEILSAFEVQAARSANQLTEEFIAQEQAAIAAKEGLFQINTQLKSLQDTASLTGDILSKSISGEGFNFSDIQKLTDANKDYLQFIEIIDGQVKINTEGLRQYDIQKAVDSYNTMQQEMAVDGLSESEIKQLEIMKAYIGSLADGSAYAEQLAAAQKKLNDEREKAAKEAFDAEKKYQEEILKGYEDQKKAADILLKLTIDMIKQQKQAEKDHLNQQMKDYDDLIDKRIAALEKLKDEEDYKKSLLKNEKKVTDIKSQIAILSLDNSAEAKAKILKLQAQLAEAQEKVNEQVADHKLELEKAALLAEKKRFDDSIKDKIQVIEDYLKQTGTITQDAMDMIRNHGEELYDQLINWNRVYGDGIDKTVVDAWNKGYNAVLNYENLLANIDSQKSLIDSMVYIKTNITDTWGLATLAVQGYIDKLKEVPSTTPGKTTGGVGGGIDDSPPVGSGDGKVTTPDDSGSGSGGLHHSGLESGPVAGVKIKSNEQLALLLKGERVYNEKDSTNFMTKVLPGIAQINNVNQGGSGGLHIENLFNVQGSIDKDTIPDLKKLANKVIEELNKGNWDRGIKRSVNQYGI